MHPHPTHPLRYATEVSFVYVKFNDNIAERETMQSDVTAWQHNCIPVKKHQALFGPRENKQQLSVKRTQFPLTLSWACTVDKLQGLSLAEGIVTLTLKNKTLLISGKFICYIKQDFKYEQNVFNRIIQQCRPECKWISKKNKK